MMERGFYEQMDDFNVPDDVIGVQIGELTDSKIISAAMDGFISLRDARKNLLSNFDNRMQGIDRVLERMEKRKKRISEMMATAPFRRRMDKIAYVLGTIILIAYSYLIGKYPHSLIYSFVTMLMSVLLVNRFYSYSVTESHYVMYLFDFCYVANALLLVLLNFMPKCQWLLITCYIFANGPLAAAIAAFRNSLVYHRVDMLTSLAIHAVPLTLSIHIRWFTVPEQTHLPVEEQRFAPFAETSTWLAFFEVFFANPLKIYFSWLIFYGLTQFVFTSKVADYTLDSSYRTFTMDPGLRKKVAWLPLPMPLIFLLSHFLYYFVLHCWAVLQFHCYYLNLVTCFVWCLTSFFNGANYYMEYFAQKYEIQLNKLS